ncbi:MAG: sigma-70 family RNA polymerase sigma factor [Candidatus Binataceae bacterium]|jgi:RNA polymerase sigma-70 factor (ECF subfamily)
MAGSDRGRQAQRELFEGQALPHLDNLYTAALHLTRNPADAKDLLQDTMLRAYRFFDQFTPGTNCRAWLLTILYNCFRNDYRRASREKTSVASEDFDREVETRGLRDDIPQQNPESILFDKLLDGEVQDALDMLPEEFRSAILLVDIEELNYQEAAGVLAVPIGTVRSRLSRGRAMMRETLRGFAVAKGYVRP